MKIKQAMSSVLEQLEWQPATGRVPRTPRCGSTVLSLGRNLPAGGIR